MLKDLDLPSLQQRREFNKQFTDYQCSNLVDINVTNNSRCFVVENSRTAEFRILSL